jgi:two-component system OmpR family sensor kinase
MRSSRLFWKLFFAFWAAMVVSFLLGFLYIKWMGLRPPSPDEHSLWPAAVPMVSGVVTALFASLWLAWYLSRPLRHVRWALDQIAGGHFSTRVGRQIGRRRDEIADLGGYLDATAERLERLESSRRQLLYDISHELRSPLSRLRAAIGLARTDPADVPAMLERVDREAERLNGLLDDLLTLNRLETGGGVLRPDRVDLIELVQAIATDADFEARALGRQLSVCAEGSFVANVDGELVYRALENVVRNAVKYTELGSTVEVLAAPNHSGDCLEVVVSDRGPGVRPEMLSSIFEPFVRDAETVGATSGFGLGLAIARRALLAHGGDIAAEHREGGGLVVTLRLPKQGPSCAPEPALNRLV